MTAQQLKNAILQEAIEGRLVPQDPNDEPASVLLQRIREEKKRLVKEGKLKKKDLEETPISEDEIPFEIPESWVWKRLSDIALDSADGPFGSNLKREHYTSEKEVRIIQLSNIGEDGWIDINTKYTTFEHLKNISRSEAFAGDIIIAKMMPAGRAIICPSNDVKYVLSSDAVRFDFYKEIDRKFLYYAINSKVFLNQVYSEVQGITRVRTSLSKLRTYCLPLPPLAEQKRIVAKIEALLPKVEEYGKAQDELNKLNEELPEKLKKSVLQEAITGKLVPQNSNDEPASVLLNRIREEKKRLVKEGKLKKKDLEETPISEDEIPFEIPESWEWVRFGTITINRDSERIPLSVEERSRLVKKYDYYGASGVIDKVDRYLFNKPLLLIGEDGANLINRSTPIAFIARGEYWVNNHAHVLDYLNEDLMQYMCWYINAISLVDYVTGTAQPKMNQEKMNSILVALPPLAEQHRIVSKIEELFAEIDKLKAG